MSNNKNEISTTLNITLQEYWDDRLSYVDLLLSYLNQNDDSSDLTILSDINSYIAEYTKNLNGKYRNVAVVEELCSIFSLSRFEELALLLSLSIYFDNKYIAIYDKLSGGIRAGTVCIGTVVRLYGLLFDVEDFDSMAKAFTECKSFKLLFNVYPGVPSYKCPLVPNRNIVAYAMGDKKLDESLAEFCIFHDDSTMHDEPLYGEDGIAVIKSLTEKVLNNSGNDASRGLLIKGRWGSGRFFSVCKALESYETPILEVSARDLIESLNLQSDLTNLKRVTMLRSCLICLREFDYLVYNGERKAAHLILDYIAEFAKLFFVTAREDSDIYSYNGKAILTVIDMQEPNYDSTLDLFSKYYNNTYVKNDLDYQSLAARFRITPGEVKKSVEYAKFFAYKEGSDIISDRHVLYSISQLRRCQLDDLGDFIPCMYTFNDLVTSERNKTLMQYAINHVKYRNIVMDKWGMYKKSSYGNNVCLMLYGAPGTGKTMAAQVIANEVGMELFRVDSSQLTSKYIGETSKNIRAIFDGAKGSNIILFFDEADSIFAKRTRETSNSNDRHANSDTSFLLQKIENYDGMVILSTNLMQNIDEAFRRRMTYMINLVKPDKKLRERLWRSVLSPKIPCDELDFGFLAEYDLVGSDIKSIVISASYMAAASKKNLCMEYLIKALVEHMCKSGKPLLKNDLKQYAKFV